MTTKISTNNPHPAGISGIVPVTDADALTSAPAAAGISRVSPQTLGSADSLYYFLEAVPTTSPRTVPALNIAPADLGFRQVPRLGYVGPSASPGAVSVAPGSPYFLNESWQHSGTARAQEGKAAGYRPEVAPATIAKPA